MSCGAISKNAKITLARGSRIAGTFTTTGDGGMRDVESAKLVCEVLPSRYDIVIRHLRQADAIELTIGQGAKPGTGASCSARKVLPKSRGSATSRLKPQ